MASKRKYIKWIRIIATRFYIYSLQERMGGLNISLGKMQKLLALNVDEEDAEFWQKYSRRFYKNIRGSEIKDQIFIDKVERRYPGSKRNLNHPLWKIVAEPEASLEQIDEWLKLLHPALVSSLFRTDSTSIEPVRRPFTTKHQVDTISQRGDLDALACVLMLAREMELLARVDAYCELKWAIQIIVSMLSSSMPFLRVSFELYEIIFKLFIEKNSPLPDHLKNPFVDIWPQHFEPPKRLNLMRANDLFATILWYAERQGFIEKNNTKRMRFLFTVIQEFNAIEVEKNLKSLDYGYPFEGEYSMLPSPLKEVMETLNMDQRKRRRRGAFLD